MPVSTTICMPSFAKLIFFCNLCLEHVRFSSGSLSDLLASPVFCFILSLFSFYSAFVLFFSGQACVVGSSYPVRWHFT